MFVFSNAHDWQSDSAVKQILVFSCNTMKELFEKEFQKRVEKDSLVNADDSNIGAIYKVRAVKDSYGKYASLIRCGFTGTLLYEDRHTFNQWENALSNAVEQLYRQLHSSEELGRQVLRTIQG